MNDSVRGHRVLLVDDEPSVTRGLQLALNGEPYSIVCADSGPRALELMRAGEFDVVVSDEQMPGMSGAELLEVVRREHPEVGRIMLSGHAGLDAVVRTINTGEIFRFLFKPCPADQVARTIREALARRDERQRTADWVAEYLGGTPHELERRVKGSLEAAWIGFQPIVRGHDGAIHGYEALLRSDAPGWEGPLAFFKATEALGRALESGRRVRELIARRLDEAPPDLQVFVNVTRRDLDDEAFLDGRDELARHARRVVLEITERMSLDSVPDIDMRLARLRASGYLIAIDDIGAGYAGLSSLLALEPDYVKFDADLIRGIDASSSKQKVVGAMIQLCSEMGQRTLAEGIETRGERDVAVDLGCQFLQGFYFGKASREFAAPIAGH